jgi:hypothetical protein
MRPNLLYYGMMAMTSIVAVSVFSMVGSVIVVALMVAPATSAFCTARSLRQMLLHALGYSVLAAVSGYCVASYADVSIAGCIAVMSGVLFVSVILCAPRVGILGQVGSCCSMWLRLSVAMVCHYACTQKNTVFSKKLIQKKYGWSTVWTYSVLLYATRMHVIKWLEKDYYILFEQKICQDIVDMQ